MKQLATVIHHADYKAFSLRAAEAGVSRRELLRQVIAKYLSHAPGIHGPRAKANKPSSLPGVKGKSARDASRTGNSP